ncbi:WXG100 family type VII secretion target [Microbacterium sp. NPDC055683]
MVQFRVRAESLAEVAGLLGSVIATFDGHVSGADAQVQNALQNWKGADADSFQQNWTRFVALSEQVRLALTGLQGGLVAAGAGYDTTEAGLRKAMTQTIPTMQGLRKHAVQFEEGVARGEARAEDMAEFFGRDYAGDDEVERFGGGAVTGSKGRYSGGGAGDTDGDGDDDGIGTTPFLSDESVGELTGDDSSGDGFTETDDGVVQAPDDATDGAAPDGAAPDGAAPEVPAAVVDSLPAEAPPAPDSSIHEARIEATPAAFEPQPSGETAYAAHDMRGDHAGGIDFGPQPATAEGTVPADLRAGDAPVFEFSVDAMDASDGEGDR